MSNDTRQNLNRRLFLGAAATALTAAALPAAAQTSTTEADTPLAGPVRNNASAFRTMEWQDHFDNLHNGAIIADLDSLSLIHI